MSSLLQSQQDYDPRRAVIRESVVFQPFNVTPDTTHLLQYALEQGLINPQEPVLVLNIGKHTRCLSLAQMIYHHVAQGVWENEAWMVSFCVVCNAGMAFSPRVNGTIHHFSDGGFYNAMTLLIDRETRSVWHHITGVCLDGAHSGYALTVLDNPRQRTAQQVLAEYPDALISLSVLDTEANEMVQEEAINRTMATYPLSERGSKTLLFSDERLPRFHMGVGIWTAHSQTFYAYETILEKGAFLATLDERTILIHATLSGVAPEAFYTQATQLESYGEQVRLNTGETLRDGILYDKKGQIVAVERPNQLFQRWYSFALLFPQCIVVP
jgi:hypothetical protein